MKVILNSCCLVQPAEPTWNGRMPLTEFDQIQGLTHVAVIYFYKLPNMNNISAIFTSLKTSLSRVLVHFYPFAGRLTNCRGATTRIDLDCNSKGAQLIKVTCDAKMDDIGSPDFHYLMPEINYTSPLEEIPIFLAQLTEFSCGGVTLSCCTSHMVTDGQGMSHFFSEWARLARGEPLGAAPFHDRKVLRVRESYYPLARFEAPLPLPLLIGQSSSKNESRKETEIVMLKLSKLQVEMLKKQANNSYMTSHPHTTTRAYTGYESITGHIWRCACRARGHKHEQSTVLGLRVDIRRRLRPMLPEKFFGNTTIDVAATGQSGELVTRPLGYACGIIRETIDRVTSEYANSAIDFLKNLKDLSRLQENQGGFCGNPNIMVISWTALSLYGHDFGWGKEIFMAPGTYDCDGDSLILRGYNGDGSLVVALCLQSAVAKDFKNFFYQDIIQTCKL